MYPTVTSTETHRGTFTLTVDNVGGIDGTTVDVPPGVTVLEGRNATNRTSFLQAVMAAMGSDQFTLKGDADAGSVAFEFDDTVVERRFERRNGTVACEGDGYLDDPELADLFAFLVEENESRRAVERTDDLREIITRPIDTTEIEAEIERLQASKRSVDDHLSTIDERERDLVDLEQRKRTLTDAIAEKEEQLAALEAEIEDADTDLEAERAVQEEVEDQLEDLKDKRSRLDDIRFEIETLEETIDSLQAEREEKQEQRADLGVDPDEDVDDLRAELDDLRARKRQLDAEMNELQNVVQFNEEMLEGGNAELAEVLDADATDADAHDHGDGDVTDRLLEDEDTVVCWTCGSTVPKGDVEETLDELRSVRQEKLGERQSVTEELESVQERVSELEAADRELDALNERLAEIDADIDRKRERIAELEADREDLHAEIEDLEAAVEDEQSSEYGDLLELHKEANRVEVELEQTESELASVEDEIAEVESLIAEREEYEQRREQITDQLEELRHRIDRLEKRAVEAFNDHMTEVLEILDYDNLARIWIERTERETTEGRRKVTESQFELHVVREADSGETYEGTIDTLSESEREVVGLVFALAGYLVHDLHEEVPVMLLDSLEAIDAERIARLVEYFQDYPTYLVVALLPEDAAAVSAVDQTITDL
jgi:chromosome segregation ATPase